MDTLGTARITIHTGRRFLGSVEMFIEPRNPTLLRRDEFWMPVASIQTHGGEEYNLPGRPDELIGWIRFRRVIENTYEAIELRSVHGPDPHESPEGSPISEHPLEGHEVD